MFSRWLKRKEENQYILYKNIQYSGYTINLWAKKPVWNEFNYEPYISIDAGWNIVGNEGGYYTCCSPNSLDSWLEECLKTAKERVDFIISMPSEIKNIEDGLRHKYA